MKTLLFTLFFIAIFRPLAAQESQVVTLLPMHAFKDSIMGRDVQLIDVRTVPEFNEGHIKNAGNIDFLQADTFAQKVEKLHKEQPLYIYCRSGHRSGLAAKKLEEMGFKKIYNLDGGYLTWQDQ